MNETTLARVRELIAKRDEIDGELDAIFSGMPLPKMTAVKRGRPRKEDSRGQSDTGPVGAADGEGAAAAG